MDTSQIWQSARLDLNRKAFAMAEYEFIDTNNRKPETLEELKSVWRRQSSILADLKK